MGQWYCVSAHFDLGNHSEEEFCKSFSDVVDKQRIAGGHDPNAYWPKKMDTILDCFKAITSQSAEQNGECYYDEFHATYSWGGFMEDVIHSIFPMLGKDSSIVIDDDYGEHAFYFDANGKYVERYEEYEQEEYDEESVDKEVEEE